MACVHHGAEADDANAQSGFAKHSVFHSQQDKTVKGATASVVLGLTRELFSGQLRCDIWEGARLDTLYPLYYNSRTVSQSHARPDRDETFSSEIIANLDHLYRVAFHLVHNRDEAQDCVQETCARALSAYRQFTPGSNMKAWLTRILYNFFVDVYARNQRMIAADDLMRDGNPGKDYWDTVTTDHPGPEGQVLARELDDEIGAALKRIPEEFRAPIVLVDMGDLTYAEAAQILSCPVGTVRSRLSRGRKLLQKQLSGYLGDSAAGS
jgi:RNA polymerase sigma-70 factor (ECF subfamily)